MTITAPTSGQRFYNTVSITVNGTARDDAGVSTVEVKAGSGDWLPVYSDPSGLRIHVEWSTQVPLTSWSTTISARATDTAGNIQQDSVTVEQIYVEPGLEGPIPFVILILLVLGVVALMLVVYFLAKKK